MQYGLISVFAKHSSQIRVTILMEMPEKTLLSKHFTKPIYLVS